MRRGAQRVSRAIVRLYPRAWRERYGAEMLALIDDSGSTWAHALDLTVGCADAWVRAALRGADASDQTRASIGLVLVRVLSETAIAFSLIPPAPLRVALHGAFWLLAALLFVSTALMVLVAIAVGFRRAWAQWFGVIHGRQPDVVVQQPPFNVAPSPRQIRALSAVILIIGIGADFTRTTNTTVSNLFHFEFSLVVPCMTFMMLTHVRGFLEMLLTLKSGRWRTRRIE